ncbi:MAG: hypothetical protein KA314_24675 [Chloroflexi bacterium]|nr:hypothetical protein [Chloroflexota bacterium]MBP8059042.1 hypothetical protein [Chloroflexota bacterium]
MSTIVLIHRGLANTVWLYFLIVGVWGFIRAVRGQSVDGNYIGALVIAELLTIVQGVLGTILWLANYDVNMIRSGIHLLYGIFGMIFLPFVYMALLRGDTSNRGQWVLSFTTLFLFGIALRSIATAV